MTFQSSKSNVQVSKETVARTTPMVVGNIPVFDAAGNLIDSGIPANAVAGGGAIVLGFANTGQANSTIGLMMKAAANDGGVNPTTSPYNVGFANGGIDPHLVPITGSIKSITAHWASIAVGTATSGVVPTIRFRIYKVNASSRTQIGADIDLDVPDYTKVNVNNNLGTIQEGFNKMILNIPVSIGDLIGVEFVNVSGNGNRINSISRFFVSLEIS